MELPLTQLTTKDRKLFEQTIWPELILSWKQRLWMKEGHRHYRRYITAYHRRELDRYQEKRTQWDATREAMDNWYRRMPKREDISPLQVTVDQCRGFIEQVVISKMHLTVHGHHGEQTAARMCRACDYGRNTLYEMYHVLRLDSGLSKRISIQSKQQSVLLFLELVAAFTPTPCPERHAAGKEVWRDLGFKKNCFPPRSFFRLSDGVEWPDQIEVLPPLRLGILACALLEKAFPYNAGYLTDAQNIGWYKALDLVGRYKARNPQKYAAYVEKVGADATRLDEYFALWSNYSHMENELETFLLRRKRYAKLTLPEDRAFWKGVPPLDAANEENWQRRFQKYALPLEQFLFESALQDCVRERAKQRLWDLVIQQL